MKKFAMLTVKGAVGLLPLSFKQKLKQNAQLTEFYSRSLQRSGLFYGFPSKKKRMAMYKHYLKLQNQVLGDKYASQTESNKEKVNLVVVGTDFLATTLQNVQRYSSQIQQVLVVGKVTASQYENVESVLSFSQAFKACSAKHSTLFIKSGDTLSEFALNEFISAAQQTDIAYCDTDEKNQKGVLTSPRFLPDWNPDLQFSTAYVKTGVLISPSVKDMIALKDVSTIAQLVAAAWQKHSSITISHIPFTLVHSENSIKREQSELDSISDELNAQTSAISNFSKHQNINCVLWKTPSEPLVSLVIPTKNAWQLVKACIDSIREKTIYKNYEILLIDNGSDEEASIRYFETLAELPEVRVLNYPGPFNYSAINNFGVKHAEGQVVGLINNDIEVISPDWLTYMVGHVIRDDIGCVGAKLLYSDGRIQHAGVVLGYGGGAGHAHKYFPRYHPGYLKRLAATQNYSAVTAACLLVKRSHFGAVGGLDEENLAVAFNDVDFCLRVRELGVRNLYCAEAELYHHESVSRGLDISPEKAARFNRELEYLQTKWSHVIKHDPAYNPNLTLKRENFALKTKEEQSVLLASY
ncbi:glycosyltransferase family 2 protein [Alteromonas stellipolaris]|uniref:glycosyltransferase family 2 protein n=1 Tax=Alteromonas stellipolaris TaxID=233316 RepID=UPI001E52EBC4|nr:glycosyltransferase family 2 protein [Alteromonas stellipolaris]